MTTKRDDIKVATAGRAKGSMWGGSLAFCWPEFEHVVSGRRAALGQDLSTVRGEEGQEGDN